MVTVPLFPTMVMFWCGGRGWRAVRERNASAGGRCRISPIHATLVALRFFSLIPLTCEETAPVNKFDPTSKKVNLRVVRWGNGEADLNDKTLGVSASTLLRRP